MEDPPRSTPDDAPQSAPAARPLARVAVVKKRLVLAAPVRVIAVEERAERPRRPRAAVGGSVFVLRPEHAVEEISLGD